MNYCRFYFNDTATTEIYTLSLRDALPISEVRVSHRRAGLGLISAVPHKGELRWMVLDGAVKAPTLIRFRGRLVRDAGRKVFLILDRLPVHRSAKVRAWLARREAEIEVFHLPPYSPELNPHEGRSEEHTSELQSRQYLVCRLLLEKK